MTLRHATVGQIARHPAELQELTTKAYDEDESTADVWTKLCDVRVSFPQQVGGISNNRELIDNYRVVGRNLQLAEIRYPGFEVTSEMRLLVDGSYYNIRGSENVEGKNLRVHMAVIKETR